MPVAQRRNSPQRMVPLDSATRISTPQDAYVDYPRIGPDEHAAQPALGTSGVGVDQGAGMQRRSAHAAFVVVTVGVDGFQERVVVGASAASLDDPVLARGQVAFG